MRLILKTVPGLEDLLGSEVAGIAKGQAERVINRGVLLAEAREERLVPLIDQSRFLTSASVLLGQGTVDGSLESVLRAAGEIDWARVIPAGSTLAVRTERVGKHEFTSIDVNRAVGEVILRKAREGGLSVNVHLNAPNVVVTVDVINDSAFFGLRVAGEESLHRKWYRVYEHVASLKPTLANALLELGGLEDREVLLDPVCGGGTIPIEAALYHEDIVAICNDISRKALRGAFMNALAAGVERRIKFTNVDVRELARGPIGRRNVDLIAADPPFGIRVGDVDKSREVLRGIVSLAGGALSDRGRISLIYPYRGFVEEECEGLGLRIKHSRKVLHGDLEAWIFIISP